MVKKKVGKLLVIIARIFIRVEPCKRLPDLRQKCVLGETTLFFLIGYVGIKKSHFF